MDVADALELDEVVWIPAGDPPHKQKADLAPASLRLEMVEAATADDPRFRVSPVEVEREGPSYTVDTLEALAAEEPGADLFLVMGIDQFRNFASWHRPDDIRRLATLVVMDRGGESIATRASDGDSAPPGEGGSGAQGRPHASEVGEVVPVRVTRVDISSTGVRTAVTRGEPVDDLVHPEVARIITSEGLYGSSGL